MAAVVIAHEAEAPLSVGAGRDSAFADPSAHVDRIQALIEERFGLRGTDWQRQRLAGALEPLLRRRGRARWGPLTLSNGELVALASELTIQETYFFREPAQIDVLTDRALPELAGAGAPGRTIRVLSAGCSSGEEAYSIALAIRDRAPGLAGTVSIHGIDLNRSAIEKARRGLYSSWALRAAPADVRERCFRPVGRDFQLRDERLAGVTFAQRNLFEDDPFFWAPASLHAIFCRNVMMYFSEGAARAILARFAAALAPGGFLFLGHAETARGLSDDLEAVHAGAALYYRRRGTPAPRGPAAAKALTGPWIDAIRLAVERVEELTSRAPEASLRAPRRRSPDPGALTSSAPPGKPAAPRTPAPSAHAAPPALGLLRRLVAAEQFEEGLALLRATQGGAPATPDLRLLEAVMLSGLGRISEVERVCGGLLEAGGGHAGAHYLLGICRENARDHARASWHYREAVRIDPGFAMAHVRAGLLARGSGDRDGSRRALRRAHAELAGSSTEHLILFGGGFTREALQALCRADSDVGSPGRDERALRPEPHPDVGSPGRDERALRPKPHPDPLQGEP